MSEGCKEVMEAKNKIKTYFYLSLIFFAVSILVLYGYHNKWTVMFPALFNFAGIILLSESITLRFRGKSLFSEIIKSRQNLMTFIVITAIGGIILDGVGKFLGKLWIYPYWDYKFYSVFVFPAYAVYWLAIVESYLAVKAITDFLIRGRHIIYKSFKFEKIFYRLLGIAGFILLIASAIIIFQDYSSQTAAFFIENEIADTSKSYVVSLNIVLLIFLGCWFILEAIEYARKRSSLVKDLIHSYFTPLIAIIVGAFVTAFIMEQHNLPISFWQYTHYPFSEIKFMNLPVTVLLTWPLQYVMFLSLFRAFTDEESKEIWRGDLIK